VPLAAGTKLGPYEIISPIGAGGMGEVYRARDHRLDRIVAIKVLAMHVSDRSDVKARFEREATTLASLSHPHICPVFDVGRQGETDYIVMEYIEGSTLAERLRRGALPVHEALRVAVEIGDALDSAHRHGIIHRDLKPANIMLTASGAKLLDFGLAKLTHDTTPSGTMSTSPAQEPMTGAGTILGTIQYMAPEQLEGKEADSRTDIFAFGSILREMITGRKTFAGTSQASMIAAILDYEPVPISTDQPLAPSRLDRVVKKCLAKNPERRWQTAADLRDELGWIAEGGQIEASTNRNAARSKRFVSVWAIAATALLGIALLIIGVRSPASPQPSEQARFGIPTPNLPNPRHLTISPDGRWVAFAGSTASRATVLFVRRIDSASPEPLAGTEGASAPFWSPDSRSIGFFAGGRMKKVGVPGGPVQNICSAEADRHSGTWNRAGTVVFASGGLLQRVSAAGGEPTPVRGLDESRQETANMQPVFLPDGNHFLYLAWSTQQASRAIYVGSLESADTVKLFDSQSKVEYAAPGYLLFHRAGALFAQPFDAQKIAFTGAVVRIADDVAYDVLSGEAAFAVSDNERLVYASGGPAVRREFAWFGRTGRPEGTAGNPGLYTTNFDLSPDGTKIAVAQRNPETSQFDIWVIDWARHTPARFTFDPALGANGNVVWSPDGLRIAFSSERSGNRDIFESTAGGTGETSVLATRNDEWPEDWSKDGRYLAFGSNSGNGAFGDLYALPLFGDRKPIQVALSPSAEDEPRFSFNGKWLAYNSNESGTPQVYVVAFPAVDQKRQISTAGGVQPRWRRDDRELYYLAPDGAVMAVEFRSTVQSEAPHRLFDTGLSPDQSRDQYAVSPDGQRFLIQLPVHDGSVVPVTLIMNWTTAFKK
jgi:eukaryotic-like serine/threonine-protein kinase